MNPAMEEWKNYLKLFNSGASREKLLTAANQMKDPDNKKVALLNLGIMTKTDKKEIKERWEAIEAITEKEMNLHCQFEGLPVIKKK